MGQEVAQPVDADLIQETLKGSESAFAELVRRYHAVVWRTARRMLGNPTDADDAAQEVFLRVFTSLERFDKTYPFHSWVKRIAANHCIDQLRSRKLRRCDSLSGMTPHEQEKALKNMGSTGDFTPLATRDPETHERVVMWLVDGLKPKHRTAFVLREVEGWEYVDIARELGVAESGARARVCRARAEVQRRFRQQLDSLHGSTRNVFPGALPI